MAKKTRHTRRHRKGHRKHRGLLGKHRALFGLADTSHGMSPLFGALIGGGVAEAAKLYAMHSADPATQANASMYGTAAGLAVAAGAFFMPKYKHAATGVAIGAVLSAGLQYLEAQFGSASMAQATTTAIVAAQPAAASSVVKGANLGVAQINRLNGGRLGVPQINYLNGARGGLGLATMSTPSRARGTIPGVAGPQMGSPNSGPPVNLLGPSTSGSRQVSLLGGGLQISGLSKSYGATLMG